MKPINTHTTKGLTLIELTLVIAIIGIISLIVIPKFADIILRAKEAAVKGKLANMRSAINIYYSDNEGIYPIDLIVSIKNDHKYLTRVPKVQIPAVRARNTLGHPPSDAIHQFPLINCLNPDPLGVFYFSHWVSNRQSGGFYYSPCTSLLNTVPLTEGHISIACIEQNSDGALWYRQ